MKKNCDRIILFLLVSSIWLSGCNASAQIQLPSSIQSPEQLEAGMYAEESIEIGNEARTSPENAEGQLLTEDIGEQISETQDLFTIFEGTDIIGEPINSPDNVLHGGYVFYDGEYLYSSYFGNGNWDRLQKRQLDSEEYIDLGVNGGSNLCIYDGYAYALNRPESSFSLGIYRFNLDTKEEQCLYDDDDVKQFYVFRDHIYFMTYEQQLYQMNLDGTNLNLVLTVNNGRYYYFFPLLGSLYITGEFDDKFQIFKVNINERIYYSIYDDQDTTDHGVFVWNDDIYFYNEYYYFMDSKGDNLKIVEGMEDLQFSSMTLDDEYLYYSKFVDGKKYKKNLETGEVTEVFLDSFHGEQVYQYGEDVEKLIALRELVEDLDIYEERVTKDGNDVYYQKWGNDRIYKENRTTGEVIEIYDGFFSGRNFYVIENHLFFSTFNNDWELFEVKTDGKSEAINHGHAIRKIDMQG